MTVMAQRTGPKLPAWELRRADLPAPAGFMVFDTPLGTYTRTEHDPTRDLMFGVVTQIVAVSWGPTALGNADTLWITFWSVTDHDINIRFIQRQGRTAEEARRIEYGFRGDLTWDNEACGQFGATTFTIGDTPQRVDTNTSDAILTQETNVPWLQALQAAWLLCKPTTVRPNSVAEVSEVPAPRKHVRRYTAAGYNTEPVRVLNLHSRPRTATRTQREGGYKIDIRFPVSGHPRWQPYRRKGTRELIWIDDHWRGPEDGPVVIGKGFQPTVSRLDRPPGRRPPHPGEV